MSIPRGGDCDGKQQFANYKLAERAALRRRNRNVYRCCLCGKFHVGGNARNFRLTRYLRNVKW